MLGYDFQVEISKESLVGCPRRFATKCNGRYYSDGWLLDDNIQQWCADNLDGNHRLHCWIETVHFPHDSSPYVRLKGWQYRMLFDQKRDAALFKLFWA